VLLRGWKEIAAHLRCGVRTAQRYAGRDLPVKRLGRSRKASVMADSTDLDRWVKRGGLMPKVEWQPNPLIGRSRELVAEIQRNRKALRQNISCLRESFGTLVSSTKKPSQRLGRTAKARQ
jgi:hypothetical protein